VIQRQEGVVHGAKEDERNENNLRNDEDAEKEQYQQQRRAGSDQQHQLMQQQQQQQDHRGKMHQAEQQQESVAVKRRPDSDQQQQQIQQQDSKLKGRQVDVMKALRRSEGRQQASSTGSTVRLSQHPSCVDDVHKYCKRSNLHNFAVVECLLDDVEVSNNNIIIVFISSSSAAAAASICHHINTLTYDTIITEVEIVIITRGALDRGA